MRDQNVGTITKKTRDLLNIMKIRKILYVQKTRWKMSKDYIFTTAPSWCRSKEEQSRNDLEGGVC